tara:strand:+ start:127 stop:1047 length:921 start_codon:yes stop_codon:yes gene_type:complete
MVKRNTLKRKRNSFKIKRRNKTLIKRKKIRRNKTLKRKKIKAGSPINISLPTTDKYSTFGFFSHTCPDKEYNPLNSLISAQTPHVTEIKTNRNEQRTYYVISLPDTLMSSLNSLLLRYYNHMKTIISENRRIYDTAILGLKGSSDIIASRKRDLFTRFFYHIDKEIMDKESKRLKELSERSILKTISVPYHDFLYLEKLIKEIKEGYHKLKPEDLRSQDMNSISLKRYSIKVDCDKRVENINKLLMFFSEQSLRLMETVGKDLAFRDGRPILRADYEPPIELEDIKVIYPSKYLRALMNIVDWFTL